MATTDPRLDNNPREVTFCVVALHDTKKYATARRETPEQIKSIDKLKGNREGLIPERKFSLLQ